MTGPITAPQLMTLAQARALYAPCLTKWRVEQSLTHDICQPEYSREYRGGAPDHPRLSGIEPGSAEWFNAVWIIKGEAGEVYPSELTDPRNIGPDDLRLFVLAYSLWWETGEGLAVDVTELERKARVAPNPLDERLPKVRGNSRWNFMQALAWALFRDHGFVAMAGIGLHRPSFGKPFYDMSVEHWLVAQECRDCGGADPESRLVLCDCLQKRVKELSDMAVDAGTARNALPYVTVEYLDYNRVLFWPDGADNLAFDRLDIEARWQIAADNTSLPVAEMNSGGQPQKTRSPAVKAGRPPDDEQILAMADIMKGRGMNGRAIAKEMRLETGFAHVATTQVRELIKGRWKPLGRPKRKGA